jgi:hypothetical protein
LFNFGLYAGDIAFLSLPTSVIPAIILYAKGKPLRHNSITKA